jgi:hypothetical protein
LITAKFSADDNAIILKKHLDQAKEESIIVAPMTFIFNEIEFVYRIQGEVCYTEMQKEDPAIYGNGFLSKADEFNTDLIILSPFYKNKLGMDNIDTTSLVNNWVILENDANRMVLGKRGQ